jgi:hypothetical protein
VAEVVRRQTLDPGLGARRMPSMPASVLVVMETPRVAVPTWEDEPFANSVGEHVLTRASNSGRIASTSVGARRTTARSRLAGGFFTDLTGFVGTHPQRIACSYIAWSTTRDWRTLCRPTPARLIWVDCQCHEGCVHGPSVPKSALSIID